MNVQVTARRRGVDDEQQGIRIVQTRIRTSETIYFNTLAFSSDNTISMGWVLDHRERRSKQEQLIIVSYV